MTTTATPALPSVGSYEEVELSADGMVASGPGRLFEKLAKTSALRRRRPTVSSLIALAGRTEGGLQRSISARRIMSDLFDVRIGAYSYGSIFVPAAFDRPTTCGRYGSIAAQATAFGRNHPAERISTSPYFYAPSFGIVDEELLPPYVPLEIGHDVWIGFRSIISSGCARIGTGAVIAAGAIVTKDVPDFAIVGGVPAKVLKYRFDEPLREALLESRWWELPPSRLKPLPQVFTKPLEELDAAEITDALAGLREGD